MSIFQFTGLSGAGKTTLAYGVMKILNNKGVDIEIIDGDEYRKTLCADLGFSRADREENIKRLAKTAQTFSRQGKIAIICAINPFEKNRNGLRESMGAKLIWINCDIDILIQRDTKGLYNRAMLPDSHLDKISNLTGINDIYEYPKNPDLILNTGHESVDVCIEKLSNFILSEIKIPS